jgi:threonine dehydratase
MFVARNGKEHVYGSSQVRVEKPSRDGRCKRALIFVTGAYIDCLQLSLIAQFEGAASAPTHALRIRPAGHVLLRNHYGKHHADEAWPVFTVGAEDQSVLASLPMRLDAAGYEWQDLTGAVDVAFRAFHREEICSPFSLFCASTVEERAGALHDFLDQQIRGRASMCYFNYRQSGEHIGRALIEFDFSSGAERETFVESIPEHGEGYRSCKSVDEATLF